MVDRTVVLMTVRGSREPDGRWIVEEPELAADVVTVLSVEDELEAMRTIARRIGEVVERRASNRAAVQGQA